MDIFNSSTEKRMLLTTVAPPVASTSLRIESPLSQPLPRSAARNTLLLFTAVFCLYFFSASFYLEDYDSINFAKSVHYFDLSHDSPHPPGAPVFVALVKLLNLVLADIPLALSLTAALGGALFVSCWRLIFNEVLPHKTALIATLMLAISPGLWMTASQPMSDALASAALSGALLMAMRYSRTRDARQLIYTSAILALALGIRPQFGLLAPFLLFATLFYYRSERRVVILSMAVFTLVNLAWLVPTVISQYNLDDSGWMTYFNQISRFKQSFDTASGSPLLANNIDLSACIYRGITHLGTLGYFALGLNLWYPESVGTLLQNYSTPLNPWRTESPEWTYTGTLYTLVFAFAVLALIPRIRYYRRQAVAVSAPIGYLLLFSIAYFLVVVMLVPPHTRFYLPLLPLFVLLPVMGLQSRRWGHRLQLCLMGLALAAALPTFVDSRRFDAPPVALVKHIQSVSDEQGSDTVLLLNSNAARHARWYLPSAHIYSSQTQAAPQLPHHLFADGAQVYSNYSGAFAADMVHETQVADFHRPYRVWMRHTTTPLYKLALLPNSAMATPANADLSPPDEQQGELANSSTAQAVDTLNMEPDLRAFSTQLAQPVLEAVTQTPQPNTPRDPDNALAQLDPE